MSYLILDVNKENEALRARIREVEDENQELQAQSLIQNRTILSMRNELALMRSQLNEMAVTSALLTERVRQMVQSRHFNQQEECNGQITTPPLMAPPPPPPPPPPLPPTFIRITPRQVGAGEALMSRLGLTTATPPRHRIKRDVRQSMRRLSRSPAERPDLNDTPTTQTSLTKPKTIAGFAKIPQLQGSFLCSQATTTESNLSASDSSDSEDGPQTSQTRNCWNNQNSDESVGAGGLHRTILENYNFTFPSAKFFLPVNFERKDKDNHTLPSTSRNIVDSDITFVRTDRPNYDYVGEVKRVKVSECVQFTFPNVHEGLHHSDIRSVVTAIGQSVNTKQIDELTRKKEDEATSANESHRSEDDIRTHAEFESESQSSTDDDVRRKESEREMGTIRTRRFDVEQDGFQADESSNCITSTENSLERVAISEADTEKN